MKSRFWEYLGFFVANCVVLVLPNLIWGDSGAAVAMLIVSAIIVPIESKCAAGFEKDRFPF